MSPGVLALLFVAGCPRPGLAPETDDATTTTTTSSAGDCASGMKEACYSGPEGTEGVGACKAGERECDASGAWGDCVGEIGPLTESCAPEGVEKVDLDCDGALPAVCEAPVVFNTISEPGIDGGYSIAVTEAGQVLWGGAVSHKSGDVDAFVRLVDEDGTILWSYEEPKGAGFQQAFQVVESEPSFFAGGFGALAGADNDGFLLRLDPGGLFESLSLVQSPGADQLNVIARTNAVGGGVFAAGTIGATADVPEGAGATFGDANDLYVMRIRQDGFVPWNMVCLGDGKASSARALVNDEAHERLYLGVTLTASLTIPYAPPMDPLALQPAANDPSDAVVYVIDTTKPAAAPVTSHLLFRSSGADTVDAIAADPDGSFYVAGTYTGTELKLNGAVLLPGDPDGKKEGFVARVTPEGTAVWKKRFGGPGNQRFHALFLSGDTLFVGGTEDAPGVLAGTSIPWAAGNDFVVARLDRATGDLQSFIASEGAGDEWITSIAVDAKGGVWLTGDFSGNLSFAGKTAKANGDFDGFLFRLPP